MTKINNKKLVARHETASSLSAASGVPVSCQPVSGGLPGSQVSRTRSSEQLINDLSKFLTDQTDSNPPGPKPSVPALVSDPLPPVRPAEPLILKPTASSWENIELETANDKEAPLHTRIYSIDDEEIDEPPIPLPTAWRKKPVQVDARSSLGDQTWAGIIGVAVGLFVILPAILFLTGQKLELPDISAAAIMSPPVSDQANRPPLRNTASVSEWPTGSPEKNAQPSVPSPGTPSSDAVASSAVASVEIVPVTIPVKTTDISVTRPQSARGTDAREPTTGTDAPKPSGAPSSHLPTLDEARKAIDAGRIQEARRLLALVASSGNPQAVFALAETYDPNILAAWGTTGIAADPAKSRLFYKMALSLGLENSRQRLKALN